MRSFAVWYKEKQNTDAEAKQADIHVNILDTGHDKWFIDFGIKIKDIRDIDCIYLYTPFVIENEDAISDLTEYMDTRLLKALFNENLEVLEGPPKRRYVKIRKTPKTEEDLIVYQLTKSNEVSLREIGDNNAKGSIIAINTENIKAPSMGFESLSQVNTYYFRFRISIPNSKIKVISHEVDKPSLLDCNITKTEIIDFRLNNIRSLNDVIQNEINKGKRFLVNSVHLLILKNSKIMLMYPASDVTTRMLEEDVWHNYFSGDRYRTGDLVAYHFKKVSQNSSVQEFNVLARFSHREVPYKELLLVLLVTSIINIISSLGYDILKKLLGVSW